MVFDAQGKKIRRSKLHRAEKLTVARNAIKRLLEPERIGPLLQMARGEDRTSGIVEFRMLRDEKRGVYNNGPTLYLFELDNADGLVSTFHREFQKLHSD